MIESRTCSKRSRERALEAELFRLYRAWAALPIPPGHTRPYYAERFRQTITAGCKRYKGGIRAVKDVLLKRTGGFKRLRGHPELTVDHLVVSGHWDDLFAEPFRRAARAKLKQISLA
jgi:hypothetical protein